jgi:hypothetical protein
MDFTRYQESVVKRVPRYSSYYFDGHRGTGTGIVSNINRRSIYAAEFKTVEVNGVEIPEANYIEVTPVAGGTPPQVVTRDTWVVFTGNGQIEILSNRAYEDIYRRATEDD